MRTDPPCIDLSERFGRSYQVKYEESYYAQYGRGARVNDLWLKIIPCQNGEICPWGGQNLAACTAKPGPTVRKLKALPYTTVAQDGDDGANIIFPVGKFADVARIMRPRRRRRLSPDQRARLKEVSAKYRFSHGVQSAPGPRPCVPTGRVDS